MLNRESLLFSPTREGVPSSDDNFYASDILAGQEALEQEARETLPFEFKECTYDLGYIRQPLYACLTCLNHGAVCAACSIACHGEHELVELFNRRHFRCDCGTEKMGAGSCCSISPREDLPVNSENKYDANFRGQFCFCGQPYDPHTETDSMYQCLVCEDWIHHKCLFGTHSDDNAAPLSEDDFDMVICERCVKGNEGVRRIAERYAGRDHSGVMLIDKEERVLGVTKEFLESRENDAGELGSDKEDENGNETMLAPNVINGGGSGATEEEQKVEAQQSEATESKREAEGETEDERATKKMKLDGSSPPSSQPSLQPTQSTSTSSDIPSTSSTAATSQPEPESSSSTSCTAPSILPSDDTPLRKLEREGGRVNVFLANDWQSLWCRCQACLPMFYDFPYLLEEEEEYAPPEDEQAHKSTFDLGMDHLLNKMPRAQALDSIRAFSGLSDRIKDYLRPLADSGVSITKEHIESFFAEERERNSAGQR
ncbi:uncharacterized protein JCM6883_001885 [Sporobolomyces salmoneus]|uniref:uncharacterized protein n=1 Tax=Sporobolomyces salmoneus TaxID=183962 RepID=UPI003173DC50